MSELMVFKELIDRRGVLFIAHLQTTGQYVGGEWVPGEKNSKECKGVILPLAVGTQNIGETLAYAENGVYSLEDRKLLTTETLPTGTVITYKGRSYTTQDFKDISDYTDVNIYLMRWREK